MVSPSPFHSALFSQSNLSKLNSDHCSAPRNPQLLSWALFLCSVPLCLTHTPTRHLCLILLNSITSKLDTLSTPHPTPTPMRVSCLDFSVGAHQLLKQGPGVSRSDLPNISHSSPGLHLSSLPTGLGCPSSFLATTAVNSLGFLLTISRFSGTFFIASPKLDQNQGRLGLYPPSSSNTSIQPCLPFIFMSKALFPGMTCFSHLELLELPEQTCSHVPCL